MLALVVRVGLVMCVHVHAGSKTDRYLKSLAFGKTKEFVHVDMHAKMTEKGLVNLFPVVCWPETKAVAEVATKLDKWKKQGVPVHFVFVELSAHKATILLCARTNA